MSFKHLRYAEQLSVGNEVLVHQNKELIPAKIINVSDFTMQGIPSFISLTLLITH